MATKQLGVGLLAGLAGTAALTAVMQVQRKGLPFGQKHHALFPYKVVRKAERVLGLSTRLWGKPEKAVIQGSNFAYGAAMGALYGWSAPRLNLSPWVSGPLFGLALWGIGLAGWLPAFGIERPPWKKSPMQAMMPVISHLAYGLAAGAIVRAYEERRRLSARRHLISV